MTQDDSAKEQNQQGSAQLEPIAELGRLKAKADEVEAALRNQHELLKKRGMSLPPMALSSLKAVRADIERLEKRLLDDQVELGQLRALAATAAKVNQTLDLDAVLLEAMDTVITLTDAERGYIILKNEQSGELEFRVQREGEIGHHQAPPTEDGRVAISYSVLNDVITSGQPLLTDNAYKDERLQGNVSIANFALRSVLCVPLSYKGNVIGAVYVDNRLRTGVFTEREKNLLTAFANTVAVAIMNARMYADIRRNLAEITAVKELMDNVFASIASGVITTNSEDVIDTFNAAASRILERQPEEVIGQELRRVLPKISADLREHLANVRQSDARQIFDVALEVPRGRIVVTMQLTPLKDANQQTHGVAIVLDDVTEQRRREQELGIMKRYLPPRMVDEIHTISQLALGGEKRTVTCMYVSVAPLHRLPRTLRPTEIMNTLNVYLAAATDCIQAVDGVIDKYIGNVIMALFNSQLNPMQDHAVQAVEAALRIRETFTRIYAEQGINPEPHLYHVGIHTGEATLGNVGSVNRRDFTAIGHTINLAKRLEENASDGEVIVSQATRDAIAAQVEGEIPFRFSDHAPVKAKGVEGDTIVYEVFRA